MTDDDLDLVETNRLVDALYRRLGSDGAVIVLSLKDRNSAQEQSFAAYRGGWHACLGLLVEQTAKMSHPHVTAGNPTT